MASGPRCPASRPQERSIVDLTPLSSNYRGQVPTNVARLSRSAVPAEVIRQLFLGTATYSWGSQSPGGAAPGPEPTDDHVENRSILNTRGPGQSHSRAVSSKLTVASDAHGRWRSASVMRDYVEEGGL